jgi:hypothetical protein
MRSFCLRLFVTATLAIGFNCISLAQSVCSGPASGVVFIRAEGLTEQVGDLTFSCSGSGGTAIIQVYVTPPLPITSKVLSTASTGSTEALAITGSGSVQGVVDTTGTFITFTGVPIPPAVGPASTPVIITNVRVNATSIAVGSGFPPSVMETVFLTGAGITTALLPATSVALIATGLGPQSVTNANGAGPGAGSPGSIAGCVQLPPAFPAFFVKFREGFGSAFKQRGPAPSTIGAWATMNTETGYVPPAWPNTPGASNLADGATRIRILLTNVPANVMVYLPTSPSTDTAGAGTLSLTASETGGFAPFSAVPPNATNGLPSTPALALVGNSGGTVDAVYEVTAQSAALETYTIPVYFAWIANTVTGNNAPVNVSVSFAPVGAPASLPGFAVGASTTPLNGPVISPCLTSLLFPFVTNESSFNTAIVISNTSIDALPNGASAQSGTCTLNFYGVGAPTPATNVLAPNGNGIGGAYVGGQSYAFSLSDVAIGFQGYLIVACNFQYAHGFASITSNFGQPDSTAMGYLAVVLNRGPATPIDSIGF